MNTKDMQLNDNTFSKLVHDTNYYRHIFKKTEKIVAAVFYILNNVDSDKKTESHIGNIASKAHLVHEHALRSLEVKRASGKEVLEQFAQALIALESTFRVAAATGLIAPEVLRAVVTEIDTVLRGLKGYLADENASIEPLLLMRDEPTPSRQPVRRNEPLPQREPRPSAPAPSAGAPPAPSSSVSRRDRIRTIIEAKGEATIKDISEIISDVSEKTIQRELQSMIEDNIVQRQGERRWSRYSLF